MDIDVVAFIPSASVWNIQWHEFYLYIMGDAAVPWFGPIPPIGHQGTQKSKQNDVDDDYTGATAPTDVTISVDNNAATASVEEDEGNHLWQ